MKAKGFAIGSALVLVGATGALSLIAAKYQEKIAPNTMIGPVPVGDLLPAEAAKKLRIWWENEKTKPIAFRHKLLGKDLPPVTAGKFGVTIDDMGSVSQTELKGFWASTKASIMREDEPKTVFPIKYKVLPEDLSAFAKEAKAALPAPRPAEAKFESGQIQLTPEVAGLELDTVQLPAVVVDALKKGSAEVELPIKEAPKHITDEELAKISEVVSQYTTHFNAGQTSRSNNISVAASKLNGVILMPGERVSFNDTVGRRTIEAGFKEAPVYKDGKHDVGIGGGICQVSSTLFNASLFANLKIVERHNHSLPVAYLPLGRDATVDYGNLDLKVENNYTTPIAINSEYNAGTLTFRILGTKDTTLAVKVIQTGERSWSNGVQTIRDRSVPIGKTIIKEKGSSGHSINTYRLVYRDGKLVAREAVGQSYYKGGPRVVLVNPTAAPKKVTSGPSTTGTASPRTQPDPASGM